MRHLIVLLALAVPTSVCTAELGSGLPSGPRTRTLATSAITITREGDRVKITFSGPLLSADSVTGPWTEVTNAASPFTPDLAAPQKVFRADEAGTPGIFSSRLVVDGVVSGPLQQYFDMAFAGTPDGIVPPRREKPYFQGTLAMAGFQLPVSLRVRGNSSLQECPFPKLKFKVAAENRPGTPFAEAREIKIGTHCAEGGRGTIGRLRDERATYREALVYETMELMGFVSARVRRGRIEYRDTSPTNTTPAGGWQIRRNAVLLEDIEVVAGRLGARVLSDEEVAALTKAGFDEQLIAELHLFHTLVGNWDYALSPDGQGLWNTDVIELPNGQLLPVAGDFDLASWVTEQVRVSAPRDYHPEWSDLERQARYQLEQIQARVSAARFAQASDRFARHRSRIESQIAAAELDDAGRTNALAHVTVFFEALAAVTPR